MLRGPQMCFATLACSVANPFLTYHFMRCPKALDEASKVAHWETNFQPWDNNYYPRGENWLPRASLDVNNRPFANLYIYPV